MDEVSFQTEYLGWRTDDLLVSCLSEGSAKRQLAVQCKRTFTVSASNTECHKTIVGFWEDFKSSDRFDPACDALLLVTLRGTETLLNGLGGLLDCARNSSDGADFAKRLSLTGHISNRSKGYSQVIRSIIDEVEPSSPVSDEEYWRFLKVTHIIPLDFTTSTAQQEALVKQALAMAATHESRLETAERTWLDLLRMSAECAAGAKTRRFSDFPEELLGRHTPIDAPSSSLKDLIDHSETTRQAIRTTIGGKVSLSRSGPETQLTEALAETEVVVVTGPAGSGKSALAKSVIEDFAKDHSCFSFRAEEFARAHMDEVLAPSITAQGLEVLLGSQERVLIHIESLERLLEHTTREAFVDLVTLVERCHNVRLLLTCREHSIETVVDSFFGIRAQKPSVIRTPPLSDDELDQVEASLPELAKPLSDPELREFLRTPYFLEMATRMDWALEEDAPWEVASFRQRCWNEIVRRDSQTVSNLPTRRDKAMVELALRRARELRAFVPADEIDGVALDELVRDDLVTREPHGLVAPVHDVIEDWAIIRWIEIRLEACEWQPRLIAREISGYPALRRGFREWMREALNGRSEKGDDFVLSAYRDPALESHFRDDVLTSMLLSRSCRDFVVRQKSQLLAGDGQLLVRLIHLLRVACRGLPPWLDESDEVISAQLQPEGEAWPAILDFVADNVEFLLPNTQSLLIGLLEDWARGSPDPVRQGGSDAVGKILFRLLDDLDGYSSQDLRMRVLEVIGKAPRANGAEFIKLIERAIAETDRGDPVVEDLAELLLCRADGMLACRDFPKQMAKLTLSRFLMSDADLELLLQRAKEFPVGLPILGSRMQFGLRSVGNFDYGNPSAYKGPFLPLLRHHGLVGLGLILKLTNHAGDWYGSRKWPESSSESVSSITLSVPGQGTISQWSNERLWMAYRGISDVPEVVQCALMALESWLLSIDDKEVFDRLLPYILRSSNNVMTTSVIASVCTAQPEKSGDAALAVLSSRDLIQMDLLRLAKERDSRLTTGIYSDPISEVFRDERIQSNDLEHRQLSLESLAVNLQFGELGQEVWEILDVHLSKIPAESERDSSDRKWLFALRRMDLRKQEFVPLSQDSEGVGDEGDSRPKVVFQPVIREMDADLQELVERNDADVQQVNQSLALYSWVARQWDDGPGLDDEGFWREALSQVRGEVPDIEFSRLILREVPQRVAAICVRDYWEELDVTSRNWCIETLIREIPVTSHDADFIEPITGLPFVGKIMNADGFAAYVLPKIVALESNNCAPRESLANAVTHRSEQVVFNASQGIAQFLTVSDQDLMLQCAAAIAMKARLLSEHFDPGNMPKAARPTNRRGRWSIVRELCSSIARIRYLFRNLERESAPKQLSISEQVRNCLLEGSIDVESEMASIDLKSWHGMVAGRSISEILSGLPDSPLSQEFFRLVAYATVSTSRKRNDDFIVDRMEPDMMDSLAGFVLRLPFDRAILCCQPLLDAIDDQPDKVADFLESLIKVADEEYPQTTCFWNIWSEVATRTLNSLWLSGLSNSRSKGVTLIRRTFLNLHWRDDLRHWRGLDGHAEEVNELAVELPATPPVLESYLCYLFRIGEQSLPRGFEVIEAILKSAKQPEALLDSSNTVFYIEMLLQRYVFADSQRLKADPKLRTAVLFILGELVDAGSSVGYRLREDFATPAAA